MKELDSDFLIRLAQNEYMINQNYLPTGRRLLKIADKLKEYENRINVFNEQLKQSKEQSNRDMRDR